MKLAARLPLDAGTRDPSASLPAAPAAAGLSDLTRERLIELYSEAMLLEDNEVRKRLAFEAMRYHVSNRSHQQVALMEQFKGLTR